MMLPLGGTLNDEQLADVLTYVRTSLAETKASAVTAEQVKGWREKYKAKTRSGYAVTAVLCGLIAAGSWGLNRVLPGRGPTAAAPVSLPVLRKVQGDFVGVDRDGKPAAFLSMRGRVTACACLYTRCPHGCAHVFTTMRDLQHHFAANSEFIPLIP